MRRIAVLTMALGLALAMSAPASGTVHEVVASFCSNYQFPEQSGHPTGDQHDPPGLTLHEHNLAQPLIASGMWEEFVLYLPEPFDDTTEVTTTTGLTIPVDTEVPTVHFVEGDRINGPHNKFPWDEETYLDILVDVPVVDEDGDVLFEQQQWIFPKLEGDGDHPAFQRCENFERGPWYLDEDDDRIVTWTEWPDD